MLSCIMTPATIVTSARLFLRVRLRPRNYGVLPLAGHATSWAFNLEIFYKLTLTIKLTICIRKPRKHYVLSAIGVL